MFQKINGLTQTFLNVTSTQYSDYNLAEKNAHSLSIQPIYTNRTPAAILFTSGTISIETTATGTITVNNYALLHLQAATGSIIINNYLPLHLSKAGADVTVLDYTKLNEITASPSGTITYGTPNNGDQIVLAFLPNDGTKIFTKVASSPGLNQFSNINQLTSLINSLIDLNATDDGTDITITAAIPGTSMNSATIIGSGTYSALSITFSGGQNHTVLTVAGHALVEGTDWVAATSNDDTAASLTVAINALSEVDATNTPSDTAHVEAHIAGSAGNSITLVSSDPNLDLGAPTLTDGYDAAVVTIAGHSLVESTDWIAATSNDDTATSLASAINALSEVNSSATLDTVDITAASAGIAGNSITTTVSDAINMTLGTPTLINGQSTTITIAGHSLVESADWTAATSDQDTADSIVAAINLLTEVTADDVSGTSTTITITSVLPGTIGNSITLISSDLINLTLSGTHLIGGNDASTITIPLHGLSTGIIGQLTTSGTLPSALSLLTNYYVIVVDLNTIRLASSLVNALAGTFIVLTNTGTGNHTFSSTSLNTTIKLQASNDGIHFTDISGDTITFTASGTIVWQLISPFYKIVRTLITPTSGVLDTTIHFNAINNI